MFHCLDTIERSLSGDVKYYGSIDLIDARHPQTILAYGLNGKPLPVENGAPLRVRVERQLGYKMPKYIHKIELVDSFATMGLGKGGYWEDRGYDCGMGRHLMAARVEPDARDRRITSHGDGRGLAFVIRDGAGHAIGVVARLLLGSTSALKLMWIRTRPRLRQDSVLDAFVTEASRARCFGKLWVSSDDVQAPTFMKKSASSAWPEACRIEPERAFQTFILCKEIAVEKPIKAGQCTDETSYPRLEREKIGGQNRNHTSSLVTPLLDNSQICTEIDHGFRAARLYSLDMGQKIRGLVDDRAHFPNTNPGR